MSEVQQQAIPAAAPAIDESYILCVDDSRTLRNIVAMNIKNLGHKVVTAEDGVEAMKILTKYKVKLVITDLNMPNMDGLTLVGEIRQNSINTATPIVMLTTESDSEKVMKAKTLGANGWIVKPFSPEKFKQVVTKVIGT
ncbi:MAG: response regulator [Rhodospirillales bacterium]|nr:response regulator [Rhodospirillales bacterium]MCB9995260.1 response regulator [Rhodospirillales bacterium]